jgi:hypothetical protein
MFEEPNEDSKRGRGRCNTHSERLHLTHVYVSVLFSVTSHRNDRLLFGSSGAEDCREIMCHYGENLSAWKCHEFLMQGVAEKSSDLPRLGDMYVDLGFYSTPSQE